jgi:hypothetical protein
MRASARSTLDAISIGLAVVQVPQCSLKAVAFDDDDDGKAASRCGYARLLLTIHRPTTAVQTLSRKFKESR